MKIVSASLKNFASYETLEFNFIDQGLTLIQGPTGAGKSTLCDAVPWVLFGRTAKDGSVDEVLSWPGNKITEGSVKVITPNGFIEVFRTRSAKAKDNDLCFSLGGDGSEDIIRGKDITDTQRLIEQHLGMNATTYLAGAYYHEFSQTAQFFTTTAKNRRQLMEQIVDLAMAKKLQTNTAERIKLVNKDIKALEKDIDGITAKLQTAESYYNKAINNIAIWHKNQEAKIVAAQQNAINFDADKQLELDHITKQYNDYEKTVADKLAKLTLEIAEQQAITVRNTQHTSRLQDLIAAEADIGSTKCTECGANKKHELSHELRAKILEVKAEIASCAIAVKLVMKLKQQYDDLMTYTNPHAYQLETLKGRKNHYISQLDQLKSEENPHSANAQASADDISINKDKLKNLNHTLCSLRAALDDLDLLSDITANFRSELVKGTIVGLEMQTNKLLSDHFDAEIRVSFSVEDTDKLDVSILKDGNNAVYTQLSKGQRQLLKLSFGVAVMKQVANYNGLQLSALFFDEATDGLDESMKLRAFKLLEALSVDYYSVFLVDHSQDLKALITNQYMVKLVNGGSVIEKA